MDNPQTFESAMAQLEDIVKQLENGSLPLADSLGAFERAVELVRFCNGELENARQKVRLLTESPDGTVTDRPFVPDET